MTHSVYPTHTETDDFCVGSGTLSNRLEGTGEFFIWYDGNTFGWEGGGGSGSGGRSTVDRTALGDPIARLGALGEDLAAAGISAEAVVVWDKVLSAQERTDVAGTIAPTGQACCLDAGGCVEDILPGDCVGTPGGEGSTCATLDGDTIADVCDNCPDFDNEEQEDADGDGVGDDCDGCLDDPDKAEPGDCGCGLPEDTDPDGDDVVCTDNCPDDSNPGQEDADEDGVGDACDPCPEVGDSDGDGADDCVDGCPDDPDKTEPGTCGCNVAEADSDGDGILDCVDNCPDIKNASQEDSDEDGVGDACAGGECPACDSCCPEVCNGDLDGNGWFSPNDVAMLVSLLLPEFSNYYWKICE